MNNGILDIHTSVANDYLKILNGTYMLSSKAQAVRSEIYEAPNLDSAASPEPIQKNIVVIPIKGPIQREDLLNRNNEVAYWGMDYVASKIDACRADKANIAVVIDMSTGGGYSNAVAAVINSIKEYKKTGRKIYVSVDMACSAGYHIAVWCDAIYANSRSSILGCMGTKWEGYSEVGTKNIGYKRVSVTSDQTPDKNREFDEALKGNARLLKENIMTPIAQHFIDDVTSNRKVSAIALKGATYAAEKGIKEGMGDGIMSLNELLEFLKKGETPTTNNNTPRNSSTPKNTSFPTSNFPKNMNNPFNFFSWISQKSAGETTPEMDGQAIQDYARLQGIEASFNTKEIGFQNQISGLKSSLDEANKLKDDALIEVANLKARLEKTPGAIPTQPVANNTAESTTTPAVDPLEDPEIKNDMAEFFNEVNTGRQRSGLI